MTLGGSEGEGNRRIRGLEALVARNPADAELHNALGAALASEGELAAARAHLERAITLAPEASEARTNLGHVLLELGELHAAEATLQRVIEQTDAPARAFVGLGRVACYLGEYSAAHDAFERALSRPDADAASVSQRCYASLLDPELDARAVVAIHRESAQRLATPPPPALEPLPLSGRRLRLGYVAAEFRDRSLAFFISGLFAQHDRRAVELYLYSDARRDDAVSSRLYAAADHVAHTAGLTHAQLAERCRSDRLDVLVDLAGHMQPNRQPLFWLAPAPVSFTYLNYPGTTGSNAFSARLSDGWADASDDVDQVGPEPLARIPGGYLAYSPPEDAPEVTARAAEGPWIFGCFNDAIKLNERVLGTWAEILARAPRARLLLKSRLLDTHDLRQRVLRAFTDRGIAPSRVELLPPTAARHEHLACYARVDVALDTFPYAGATTTCEALYMGVPVVTLAGDRHAARLGVSILNALALTRWIAPHPQAYIQLALQLAADTEQRATFRRSAREQMHASPLCDARRVARAVEEIAREHRTRK